MVVDVELEYVEGYRSTLRLGTDGSAGIDLPSSGSCVVAAGGIAVVPTGIKLAIPRGFCGLIWPRSGLAVKHGIDTLAGVVDSDYRGEVKVVLINHGTEPFVINPRDRVAQILISVVPTVRITEVEHLRPFGDGVNERGEGGFGHTGMK